MGNIYLNHTQHDIIEQDAHSLLSSIDIEFSGYCNADCIFCPRHKMSRDKAFLTKEILETLLLEVSSLLPEGPRTIFCCGFGEPLLNKDLFKLTELMNVILPDTLIVVVSNGGMLNRKICDALLTGEIFAFSCSIQSIHKDKYESSMRGLSFETVMYWMNYMAKEKIETGLNLSATCVRISQTDHEIAEYLQFWDRLGVQGGEIKQINRGGFLDGIGNDEIHERKHCSIFSSRLFVAANGDVLACCQDLDGQSKLGTIGVDSLTTILDKKRKRIKQGHLFPMCTKCNDPLA